jgi:hypothetical protein
METLNVNGEIVTVRKSRLIIAIILISIISMSSEIGLVQSSETYVANLQVSATSPHNANGVDFSRVTIYASDIDGNPVTGADICTILCIATDSVFSYPTIDLGNGTYTSYVNSTIAGTGTILAVEQTTGISGNTTIIFTPSSLSQIETFVIKPRKHKPRNVSEIMFVTMDEFGNPIVPPRIEVNVTTDLGALSPITVDKFGDFHVNLTSNELGIANVTITAYDTLYGSNATENLRVLFPSICVDTKFKGYFIGEVLVASVNVFSPPTKALGKYYLKVSFNSSVIQFLEATDHNLNDTFDAPDYTIIDNNTIIITQLSDLGEFGSVDVANLTFAVKSVGSTYITIVDSLLLDPSGAPILLDVEKEPPPKIAAKKPEKILRLNMVVLLDTNNKTAVDKSKIRTQFGVLRENFRDFCVNIKVEFQIEELKFKEGKTDFGNPLGTWYPDGPQDASKNSLSQEFEELMEAVKKLKDGLKKKSPEWVNIVYVGEMAGFTGFAVSPNDFPKYNGKPHMWGAFLDKGSCGNDLKHELGHILLDYGGENLRTRNEHCKDKDGDGKADEPVETVDKRNFMYPHHNPWSHKIDENQRKRIMRCTNDFLQPIKPKVKPHEKRLMPVPPEYPEPAPLPGPTRLPRPCDDLGEFRPPYLPPRFEKIYHFAGWDDTNSNGEVDPLDHINLWDVDLNMTLEPYYWHIDNITVFMKIAEKPDLEEIIYIEFEGGWAYYDQVITHPQNTSWKELYPNLTRRYLLEAWIDEDENGVLSSSDQIILQNRLTSEQAEYQVDEASAELIITPKPTEIIMERTKDYVGQGFPQIIPITVYNYYPNLTAFTISVYDHWLEPIGTQTVTLNPIESSDITIPWAETAIWERGYQTHSIMIHVYANDKWVETMSYILTFKITIVGDINGDNKVDILDIATSALAFGSYRHHPRYNPNADLNGDEKINILDIATMAMNFGKTSS